MMILLHTADWHLGHRLHGVSRMYEHEQFLKWLLEAIVEHAADALLIAGDIFDTANPSAKSQELWYRFLAHAKHIAPELEIVVIGGNHDSPARLDAPNPLLTGFNVHVVGGLPLSGEGLCTDRLLVPLRDSSGKVAALVAAVPFLRSADLPPNNGDDSLVEGVRVIYKQVLEAAVKQLALNQALVVMGHCYLTGTQLSELSERKILGGNQHALPLDIFMNHDLAYIALGHLHLAQDMGRDNARYSGSPIPLSLAERDYPHQVVKVTLEGARFVSAEPLAIPRAVGMYRVPMIDSLPLPKLLRELAALKMQPQNPEIPAPFLEVAVTLEQPEPNLRQQIEDVIADKGYHLARITTFYASNGEQLGAISGAGRLEELQIEEVFLQRWHQDHEAEPPPILLAAFHELLDFVHQEALE